MRTSLSLLNISIVLSVAAFLSFLGRGFLDFYAVMPEFGVTMPELMPITLAYTAFFGGWLWALLAASEGSRSAWWFALFFNLALVAFGVSTVVALCPSPCQTAWPLGENLIWSNILIGLPAVVVTLWQNLQHRQAVLQP
jgi:hypothetical protein